MPISKEERDRRVAEGMCEQCNQESVDGNSRKGARCKQINKESRARTKQRKIVNAICIMAGCNNKAKEGCAMCQDCIYISSTGTNKAYKCKKESGCCPYCPAGTPCESGFKACTKHLDKVNTSGKKLHRIYRKKVFDHYGWECACCGLTLEDTLQIDHIDGKGAEHRKEISTNLYLWIIKNDFPAGFQTLCVLCNWWKGKKAQCPHTTMPKEAQQLTRQYTKELDRILKKYKQETNNATQISNLR